MILSNARSTAGLSARVTPTTPTASGTLQIGANDETNRYTTANAVYSVRALFAGNADAMVIDLFDGDTTGSTAWTAGTAQVETATAAGTISTSGNATVVVTGAGISGSPVTVSVAVTSGDTAAVWAGKVRTALGLNAAISALYSVGGTTTAISLTRKASNSIVTPQGTVNFYPANDSTLNISLNNGTCAGITTAATSANTTAGVATDGVKIYGADVDFEGIAIPTIEYIKGILIDCALGEVSYEDSGSAFLSTLTEGDRELKECDLLTTDIGDVTFTAAELTDVTITVLGITG